MHDIALQKEEIYAKSTKDLLCDEKVKTENVRLPSLCQKLGNEPVHEDQLFEGLVRMCLEMLLYYC